MNFTPTAPSSVINVSIPTALLNQIDLLLLDPFRGKAVYGARSQLICKLLEAWLHEQSASLSPSPIAITNTKELSNGTGLRPLPRPGADVPGRMPTNNSFSEKRGTKQRGSF